MDLFKQFWKIIGPIGLLSCPQIPVIHKLVGYSIAPFRKNLSLAQLPYLDFTLDVQGCEAAI